MATILKTKSIYYNDVNLIAQPSAVNSRSEVPRELNRIIVSPMEAVIGETFAKEADRLQRVEKRQQQKEIIDLLQTMGIIFCVVAVLVIGTALYFQAFASGKIYNDSKPYTRNQKINNGTIVPPVMTTCRLKKQKVFKDKMACIYVGAQKTYELEFTDIHIGCPRKYKCKLNPNGKEPSIDQVMESLRSISK